MTPRVLLVTNDYPPERGGIQRYLVELVAAYPGEMSVAAPADPTGSPAAGIFPGPAGFMWPTGGTRQWLARVIKQTKPDVVLFGAPHPLAFLGPGLDRPYAVLAHGAEVSVGRVIPVYGALMARALRRAGAVMAVSEHTARAVARAAGVEATVVGAGVDLSRFPDNGGQRDQVVLFCMSRFVPRKGHLRVLAAGEELAARGVPVKVVLAGEGRMASTIQAQADRAEVPVEVIVGPSDTEVVDLYSRASIFCMPARSRWFGLEREGLGLVYLEAAAAGLPVLAGRSGGAPETIDPGVTGFVVDTPSEIADAARLLLDPETRATFGAAGRRRAEQRHAWPLVADKIAKILETVS